MNKEFTDRKTEYHGIVPEKYENNVNCGNVKIVVQSLLFH